MTELIVAEKPDAAKNIAQALANAKPIKKNNQGVPYYLVTHGDKDIIVASAVGHLYTVAGVEKRWDYPQFDIKWDETSNVDKKATYTKKYVQTLKKLCKECDEFTVATDYDIEGEVIGHSVITRLCKQKDASRMKFSTLTKPDILESYENKQSSLDWGQAQAGITRHELDWYYGINLTSALTSAVKAAGSYKLLSSGRVQGPALKLLCDKEREIKAFIPEPYWMIQALGDLKTGAIEAWHEEDKIFNHDRAQEIMKEIAGKNGVVDKKSVKQFNQAPPHPFDLTSFQIECYRVHKITPKETLSIAQELYTGGFISYPRTSSQKLPAKLGFPKILKGLQKQDKYAAHAQSLLAKKTLKPNEGKKTDDAHPAIYPTGIPPSGVSDRVLKVYDLVVRRFLATFGEPAVRETVKATVKIGSEPFIAKGTTTKVRGWHELYGPYAIFDETLLPDMSEGDSVTINSTEKQDKETQPPKRYTAASIIKELEKRNLGTKATRATIVDNLYARGYVNNKSMEVTDIGLKTCSILEKYSPRILDEALTREFEEYLEHIRKKKETPEQVLEHARTVLTGILTDFKAKEKTIGEELKQAEYDSRDAATTLGPCPKCEGKGNLKVRRGKYGEFIGCDAYPDCKTIVNVPRGSIIKPTKKVGDDGWPIMQIKSGKGFRDVSVNAASHESDEEDAKKYPEINMACPNCEQGKMILRKSFYGEFLGCDGYPDCRTMMKIVDGKVDTTPIVQVAKKTTKKAAKKTTKKATKKTTKKTTKKATKKTTKKATKKAAKK